MAIPVDSADARELREVEQARVEAAALEVARHARLCRGGWLGEDLDGRPIPCPVCRPWLLHAVCHVCGIAYEVCASQQATRRGPCCDQHDHSRRVRARARSEAVVAADQPGEHGAAAVAGGADSVGRG